MKAMMSALLLAVVLPVVCVAQDDAAARIERLVGQLGAAKFDERQQAERELKAMGMVALPALLKLGGAADPEVRMRANGIILSIAPEMTSEVLSAIRRIAGGAKGEERRKCIKILFETPDRIFEKLFPLLVSERDKVMPAAIEALNSESPMIRTRAARYIRSFEGIKLSDDVQRRMLVQEGKWSELLAMGKVAYSDVAACLAGKANIQSRELKNLVRVIRFRHRDADKEFGPALVAALPAADSMLCKEIAKALVVLKHEPEKPTPFLLKLAPSRPDLPISYGITNSIDEVLAFAAKDPKAKKDQKAIRWQLRAIGLLGRRGAKYLDRFAEQTKGIFDSSTVVAGYESLANIGPKAIPVALEIAGRGRKTAAFYRVVTMLGEEGTLGNVAADRDVTQQILTKTLGDGFLGVLARPHLVESLDLIEQGGGADVLKILRPAYADVLAVVRAMAGKNKTAIIARLHGAQGSNRVWPLVNGAIRAGLAKEAGLECAKILRQERLQGLDDLVSRQRRIQSVVSCLYLLKEHGVPGLSEMLDWVEADDDKLTEKERKNIEVLRNAIWGQIEYLAPYSKRALEQIIAKAEANPGWVSSMAYAIAYGLPLDDNDDVTPLAKVFAGACAYTREGKDRPCVWHARFGARGLVMLGKRAVMVVPALEKIVKEEKSPISSFARAALVRITGKTEPHITEIRKRLTAEAIMQDMRYRTGLPVPGGHSAHAVELMGPLAKELSPELERLCSAPSLHQERRREMVRAYYVVDGGGERSSKLVADILDCPLVLEEWLTREFPLRMLREFGVPSPVLQAKVREMVLAAHSCEERAIARAIVKNGFKPELPEWDDVER